MSASAKPVEKVFKSLLAVVLAVSLCPLAQAGQAQAQETEENGSEASAMSMPVDESDAQPSGLDDNIAPQSAESSDPIVDWTTCGTARWMIDASGCLVIAPLEGEESGELGYWDYRGEAPWYSRRQAITSVKVDGHVAAQTTYSMFDGCSSLASLDLSSLDTSKVIDMSYMFRDCSRLVTIYASASFSTASVVSYRSMFSDCSRLTGGSGTGYDHRYDDKERARIDSPGAPGYFTDKSASAYAALYGDGSLVFQAGPEAEEGRGALVAAYPFHLSGTAGGTPPWSGAAARVKSASFSMRLAPSSMRGWFSGMSSLESVDLTNLDASSVTDMRLMFYGCSSLSSLDLSTFDTSKVTDMSSMFEGCSGLRSVSLGGRFSFSGATGSRLCSLPTPSGNEYSGLWESSADGEAYAPDEVPDNVAATYTARKVKTDLLEARASVSDIPDQTYTGSAIEPKVTVTLDGKKLVLGVDYTVSYANNVEVGTAVATIVGIGDYEGTIQKEFTIAAAPARTFPDVDYDNDWFAPAVTFVSSRGLITGYADSGEFGPLDTLTRGQLATILWRNACPDEAASYDASEAVNETGLSGVDDHEYYTAAANWAVREGIITGFEREDGTYDFAASSPVSFEQLITILSRLGATSDEVAAAGDDLSEFLDGDNASPWSRSPIAWAAEKGLVGGYENEDGTRTLAPGEDVSRGRAATVLMRAFALGIMG